MAIILLGCSSLFLFYLERKFISQLLSLSFVRSDNGLLDAKLQVFGFNSILDMTKPLKVNIIDNGILDAIYLQWNSSCTYVK